MQVLLKFWLGLPLDSPTELCPFCSSALDAMGHHSLTCKHGGFVIARHNRLRDCLAHFCQIAGLAPEVEKGCNFGCKDRMCPADVLVPNWSLSRPAAFDLKVINPLNSDSILERLFICADCESMVHGFLLSTYNSLPGGGVTKITDVIYLWYSTPPLIRC